MGHRRREFLRIPVLGRCRRRSVGVQLQRGGPSSGHGAGNDQRKSREFHAGLLVSVRRLGHGDRDYFRQRGQRDVLGPRDGTGLLRSGHGLLHADQQAMTRVSRRGVTKGMTASVSSHARLSREASGAGRRCCGACSRPHRDPGPRCNRTRTDAAGAERGVRDASVAARGAGVSAATVTLAPAEPMERPREPTPENLHEQLARCLVFQAEKDQRPVTTLDYHAVTARVKARNDCDTALPGEEAWIEVRAIVPVGGRGLIGREYARFQGPITARSSAETFVRIENSTIEPYEFYRFDVALWWAAGSGRRPE
jgi:hypothetical protein